MGTLVTIHVVRTGGEVDAAIDRAFGWFHEIEERCTRFDPHSELMQLTAQAGVPVPASPILYEAVRFALMVAEESGGAFDPTVGHHMEARGFNREHRTGEIVRTAIDPDDDVSYRDVQLDPDRRTILLRRPLILDLGAVAKGLAVDTAARELEPFHDFAIDAGGDLYLGGSNPQGAPWSVGIRHPRHEQELIDSLRVSNQAVCTSGDYERETHILDPRKKDASEYRRQRDRRGLQRDACGCSGNGGLCAGAGRRHSVSDSTGRRGLDRNPRSETLRNARPVPCGVRSGTSLKRPRAW